MFASSCSLYDGLPPGMHDETAPIIPRGAYATSKRYGEEALLELVDEGLCPVILRNGTVYGYSPRMRFDLVVNTFVKDALLTGRALPARRRLDVAPAGRRPRRRRRHDRGPRGPAELVRGEIFNVVHSNYQIRELAMLVAGSVQLLGTPVTLREEPAPRLTRDYECSNTKLASRLGFQPSRSVVEAIDGILAVDRRRRQDDVVRPAVLQHPLARAAQRADASDRPVPGRPVSAERVLITGRRRPAGLRSEAQLRGDAEVVAPSRAELDITDDAAFAPRSIACSRRRLQLRRLPQRRGLRDRGGPRLRRSTRAP